MAWTRKDPDAMAVHYRLIKRVKGLVVALRLRNGIPSDMLSYGLICVAAPGSNSINGSIARFPLRK